MSCLSPQVFQRTSQIQFAVLAGNSWPYFRIAQYCSRLWNGKDYLWVQSASNIAVHYWDLPSSAHLTRAFMSDFNWFWLLTVEFVVSLPPWPGVPIFSFSWSLGSLVALADVWAFSINIFITSCVRRAGKVNIPSPGSEVSCTGPCGSILQWALRAVTLIGMLTIQYSSKHGLDQFHDCFPRRVISWISWIEISSH